MVIIKVRMQSLNSVQEKIRGVRNFIQQGGAQVIGVENSYSLTYTIGLLENFGNPEVAVTGMPIHLASRLLNVICDELARGRKFETDIVYRDFLDSGYPFIFRTVHGSHFTEAFKTVMDYYSHYPSGNDFVIWQLFWSGGDKKFPWENFSKLKLRDQPRLDLGKGDVRDA
jgi:hypothetical protein